MIHAGGSQIIIDNIMKEATDIAFALQHETMHSVQMPGKKFFKQEL